jgi:hypothetical protein
MDHKQLENQPWPLEGLERAERCPIYDEVDRALLHNKLTDKVFFLRAEAVVTVSMPGLWHRLLEPKADFGQHSHGL